MMKKCLLGLSAMALLLTACQSNSFKIDGVAEGLEDGDTIYVADDFQGEPTDTLIIKDGKFELSGTVDSVKLCTVYSQKVMIGAAFFKEPGTIKIFLSAQGDSKVSGTKANDGWQELNDMQAEYSKKMEELVAPLYTDEIEEEQQKAIVAKYESLQQELTDKVIESAEKNIDNELGFFIVSQLGLSGSIPTEKLTELLGKMPSDFKNRQSIKDIEKSVEAAKSTEIGKTIQDFSLPTPEGEELSVMSEVKKNKVTILDFWASWCGPCREETPFMVSLYEKYHNKGLGIVGISLDQDHDAWTKGIADLGITWPQISDLKYWQSAAAEMFQVRSIPYMVVVDQQGVILNKNIRGEQLEKFVSEQLQ